jgi:hypothetical protein
LEGWIDVKEYADAEKSLIGYELTNKDNVITIINKVGIMCILLEELYFLLLYLFLFLFLFDTVQVNAAASIKNCSSTNDYIKIDRKRLTRLYPVQ